MDELINRYVKPRLMEGIKTMQAQAFLIQVLARTCKDCPVADFIY